MTYDRIYFDCSGSAIHDKRHNALGRALCKMEPTPRLFIFSSEVSPIFVIRFFDDKIATSPYYGHGTDLAKVVEDMKNLPMFSTVLIITDDTRYVEEALSHPDVTVMDIEDCYEALGLETLKSKALKLGLEKATGHVAGLFGDEWKPISSAWVDQLSKPEDIHGPLDLPAFKGWQADRPEWEELFKHLPSGWTRSGNNTVKNGYGENWHVTNVQWLRKVVNQ